MTHLAAGHLPVFCPVRGMAAQPDHNSDSDIGVFGSAETGHDSSWYLQRVAVVIIVAGLGLLAYCWWFTFRASGPRLGGWGAAWRRIRGNMRRSKADKMEKGTAGKASDMDYRTVDIQEPPRAHTPPEKSSIDKTHKDVSDERGQKEYQVDHVERPSPTHASKPSESTPARDPNPNSMLNI
ncbi:hypothetical protein GQ53DRAFT_763110 [Thozetella sp. PMI_491]|nr:hypothetical protein GQ53DRAFT_763110 [Thozetella sp. PMI_491]